MLTQFTPADKKNAIALGAATCTFVALIVGQDLVRAYLQKSAFYLSESILFSMFWWIFVPLLIIQYKLINRITTRSISIQLVVIILFCLIHLLAFPLIVRTLSTAFYYHTYSFLQTLVYAFSEYAFLLIVIYSTPFLVHRYFVKKKADDVVSNKTERMATSPINTILVTEGIRKLTIPIADVLYFQAASPYIWVHLEAKKYLYNESLKSMAAQLKSEQFVRVHKSTLVNMHMVVSYTSRLNGDYDLMMKNKVTLRVSRNFAAEFKQRFGQSHHLA